MEEVMMPTSDWLGRDQLDRHSVEMRQFIDFRQSTLPNGMRIIEAYNASGLSYTVLPDRGLDIWTAHYKGIPLTWVSQGSPFVPDVAQPWLRQFNGGLLTTCGLTHAGPPEKQPITDGGRDLHGLYSRLRANEVAIRGAWGGESYVMDLTGVVSESTLFGEQLRLKRTYRLVLNTPIITWSDRVTNLGDNPVPLMVLYHINLGYPLIQAGTQFQSAHQTVIPRDAEAEVGFDRWPHYEAAIPRFAEQVYFHHVKADRSGRSVAALLQSDFGLQFEWDTRTLPYLTQWKNTRQGIYVSGIEPGNCLPEGQVAARDKGRLVMLEPGEERVFNCALSVLDGTEAIAQSRVQIETLRRTGAPVADCKLDV
jgi:galactose mutarotase-like enzyme